MVFDRGFIAPDQLNVSTAGGRRFALGNCLSKCAVSPWSKDFREAAPAGSQRAGALLFCSLVDEHAITLSGKTSGPKFSVFVQRSFLKCRNLGVKGREDCF